jgi:haloacetate dehalogenase
MAFALGYYHWFWFAQPHPKPESVINAAPDEWFSARTSRDHVLGNAAPDFFAPEARTEYLSAHDPRMCEDDRAAVSIDLVHDRASRLDGARVRCPMLVLWGAKGRIGGWYDPLALWREHCEAPVAGGAVASGHYLAEEAPAEVLGWLTPFLADAEQGRTRA